MRRKAGSGAAAVSSRLLETPEDLLRRSIPAWSGLLRRRYRYMDPTDLAFAAIEVLEVAAPASARPERAKGARYAAKPWGRWASWVAREVVCDLTEKDSSS